MAACGNSAGRGDAADGPMSGAPTTGPVSPSTTSSQPPVSSVAVCPDPPIRDSPDAGNLDPTCATGVDSATDVPGPQPTAGAGWRLLTNQRRGEPYTAHVAVNAAEYEALWVSLAMEGEAPAVNFDSEIVVQFGAVYGSSCPEIRLDDVTIEPDRGSVSAEIVSFGDHDECTADANPRSYVVAVDRARLPAVPFRVSLQPGCWTCESVHVHDLTGDRSPNVALSEYDRWKIFGAAAANRVGADNSFGGEDVFDTIDIVEVVGLADQDGFVRFDAGGVLTEDERNDDGTWTLTPVGPQWIS